MDRRPGFCRDGCPRSETQGSPQPALQKRCTGHGEPATTRVEMLVSEMAAKFRTVHDRVAIFAYCVHVRLVSQGSAVFDGSVYLFFLRGAGVRFGYAWPESSADNHSYRIATVLEMDGVVSAYTAVCSSFGKLRAQPKRRVSKASALQAQ